ncbi:metal ABC transporter ATP-binding protein [Streptomyces sp. AJS327]|uniref:zinc ABC transporter ATP-binding protein AztA n=1 Tax=Streptomyces sp. AJS327 TaxID=2545265 RepID=UPI0015DDDFB6|nr:zinc ABC transporter ATP-binding protein AztA [Streptomyces sp. AJS327]MBA0052478.1 metal ABC transporter ATP-binding protein [Streptomyces sp. AJS327]
MSVSEKAFTAASSASAVRVSDLCAGYGRHQALHQLTAHIPQFATTAIVGPNGSGKSTLLGVLAGVIHPTRGEVLRRDGERPAFVMQRSAVSDNLPLTVRDAVAMGRWTHRRLFGRLTRRDREIVADSMERMGVGDLAGRQLGGLSGGQRQRALVAQGLAQRAPLLLLDEPTTGLDATARRHIARVLDGGGTERVTVAHATHDLPEALGADHCLLLADGQLVAEGPPSAVLTREVVEDVWQVPRLSAGRGDGRC